MNNTDEKYFLALNIWAMLSKALTELNDAVTWRKLVERTEAIATLQRTIAAANVQAQDWKNDLAREFDAAEDVG